MITIRPIDNDIKRYYRAENKQAKKAFYSGTISQYVFNQQRWVNFWLEENGKNFLPLTAFAYQETTPNIKIDLTKNPKPLRDYQEDIIAQANALKSNSKIFVLGTGAGKSVIATHLIRQHSTRTLVLLPTTELLKQMCNTIEEFGINVTMFGNGKKDLSGDVVCMTMKSLSMMTTDDLINLPFELVIIDELQKSLGPQIKDAILKLSCKNLYAFSATPYTNYLDKEDVKRFFGEMLIWNNTMMMPTVYKYIYNNPRMIDMSNYTTERMKVIDNDERRLKCQIDLILNLYDTRKNIMVLYDRVNHSNYVYNYLLNILKKNVYILNGEMPDKDRTDNLNGFKDNGGILLASDAIAGTGLDAPRIDTVLLCYPSKFDARTIQSVGRGLRPAPGKTDSIIVDFVDSALMYQYYARLKVYRSKYNILKVSDISEYIEKSIDF